MSWQDLVGAEIPYEGGPITQEQLQKLLDRDEALRDRTVLGHWSEKSVETDTGTPESGIAGFIPVIIPVWASFLVVQCTTRFSIISGSPGSLTQQSGLTDGFTTAASAYTGTFSSATRTTFPPVAVPAAFRGLTVNLGWGAKQTGAGVVDFFFRNVSSQSEVGYGLNWYG